MAPSIIEGMSGAGFYSLDEAMRLVENAMEAVSGLVAGERWKLNGDELLNLSLGVEKLSRKTWAAQVQLTDELDQQGVATARSVSSTAALLRETLRISPGEASARVAAARATQPQDLPSGGERPAQRPILGVAIDSGDVSVDHVRTIVSTLRRLPDALPAEVVSEAERVLVENALIQDPEQLKKLARHLECVLDPDGTPPDDTAARSKMELTIGSRSTATGLTGIHGYLNDLGVAALRAVIDPLAAPKPAVDGSKDPRPAATRRAHALVEVLEYVLRTGGNTDNPLPETAGVRPHITVTLDWDILKQQARGAVLDDGHRLSPADTRRLLCDAGVIPAVLGGAGEVLDLGRSSRTFGTAIRRAITVRDRGCSFPGCTRPPNWCDAHHLKWWARDLGETSYQNGTLLCAFHHTEIHRGDWRIQPGPDGVPEFVPPKWLDREQKPRRNTVHHIDPPTITDG